MEIYNLEGVKREYIIPTWLTARGWDRLVSMLVICRNERDMDMIFNMAEEYVRRSKDENLSKLKVQLFISFGGSRFYTTIG